MRDQIYKYTAKLISDRSAIPAMIAIAAQDDITLSSGEKRLSILAEEILQHLSAMALCIAQPSLHFADFLLQRTPDEHTIVPRDTETRTFLHDIPLLRQIDLGDTPATVIAHHLGNRKGVIVEGIGIIAVGAFTVEQAYINWSSVFHSTFVKYLEDLLDTGFLLPEEPAAITAFQNDWLLPLRSEGLDFRSGALENKSDILDEIVKVGGYTVRLGLVDSFFGNISCSTGDLLYISQTASSLDELSGCIDPVPFENSSTVGITASSELAAHRRIYETTGYRVILHGHPRFSVIMSMQCRDNDDCDTTDCWKNCKKVRYLAGTPVVAGEIGAGGLAKNVPPVIADKGRAIVYGHGVFTAGRSNFKEAFDAMIEVESWCREEYFRQLAHRWGTYARPKTI